MSNYTAFHKIVYAIETISVLAYLEPVVSTVRFKTQFFELTLRYVMFVTLPHQTKIDTAFFIEPTEYVSEVHIYFLSLLIQIEIEEFFTEVMWQITLFRQIKTQKLILRVVQALKEVDYAMWGPAVVVQALKNFSMQNGRTTDYDQSLPENPNNKQNMFSAPFLMAIFMTLDFLLLSSNI